MFDENQGKSDVVGIEKTQTARATPHTERRHQVGVSTAKLNTGRGASHVRTLKSCEAETGAPSACHLSKAARHPIRSKPTHRDTGTASPRIPLEWCPFIWAPPPPKKRTFGKVSSSGCTPRTPTAAAITRLAATRPPTPADAAEAPNTNMRALRKGASVSSRRRVACE